ncbi:MAG: hypothetical protein R2744_00695 [Bacteroidales bacterium]
MAVAVYSCKNSVGDSGQFSARSSENRNLYSELFSIEHLEGYTRLVLRKPWQGAGETTFEYLLTDSPDSIFYTVPESRRIITRSQRLSACQPLMLR